MNLPLRFLTAFVLWVLAPAIALAQGSLLSVEQAFQLTGVEQSAHEMRLTWTIATGYAIYRDRLKVASFDDQATVGAIALPTGRADDDPSLGFGPIYESRLSISVPYTIATGATTPTLTVSVNGCHHTEPLVCYPPYRIRIPLHLNPPLSP